MPLSVSFESGEPVHMLLHRSLNGLRNASAHWMLLLSRTIQSVGLWSDSIEPCIYGGFIRDPKSNEVVGSAMLVAYVDDILIASSSLKAEEIIVKTIGGVVPVKTLPTLLLWRSVNMYLALRPSWPQLISFTGKATC